MAFRLVNREKLLPPNKCLLCERVPSERVVDSGYNLFRTTVAENMRGRKYICERCGELTAKALGFLSHNKVAEMKEEMIRLQNRVVELEEQVELTDAVHRLTALVQVKGSLTENGRTGGVGASAVENQE